MGNWKIVVPEAATNVVPNPSIEQATTGYFVAGTGTTIAQSSAFSRFGVYSLACVTGNTAANDGWFSPFSTLTYAVLVTAGLSYTFSVYLRGSGTVTMRMDFRNAAFASTGSSASSVITLSSAWTRYTLTATAPALSVLVSIQVRTNAQQLITFYSDGLQVEQAAYATTYVDGDQPGGTWAGLRHSSTSSRGANYRLGGREYDIETQYGLRVRNHFGGGSPDHEIMTQDLALQPGSVYLRDRINARTLTLVLDNNHTSLANLHSRRKAFWNVIKPDALGGGQPFLIGYSGAASGKTVYSAVRYAGGWGIEGGLISPNRAVEADASVALRLLAVDPFWYADDAESATLDYTDDVASNNRALARIGGAWQNLGTGFSGTVTEIKIDKNSGRVYFGGSFATANGVTVNNVCYWNGATFVAMGATPGVNSTVYAIEIAPNGDVWVGGNFTTAGGAASNYIAKWTPSTNAWAVFGAVGAARVYAIGIDLSGNVYVGGSFTNWNGIAAADYIVKYDGSTWTALGTGMNLDVNAIRYNKIDNKIYCGGLFTTSNGVTTNGIAAWNGTTFEALGSGVSSSGVFDLAINSSGKVYVVGGFTAIGGVSANRIAVWGGSSWRALGTGLNADGYQVVASDKNFIYVSGAFTTAGGVAINKFIAAWVDNAWFNVDAVIPGTPVVYALDADSVTGNLFAGYDTTGTALVAGRTTVTVLSTAPVYPLITITGPTTAASTSTLQWLENQTTGERLYFNLVINTGEIITIDLRPQSRKVTSNWRGQIFDQPLPTSDFSSWHLVTGANTVAAFMTGTITGATMTMNWEKIHASIDGEAA